MLLSTKTKYDICLMNEMPFYNLYFNSNILFSIDENFKKLIIHNIQIQIFLTSEIKSFRLEIMRQVILTIS